MSDFGTFITSLMDRVENKNTRTEPFLRAATIRALKRVSNIRSLFMQGSFTFSTVAGQQEYSSADAGFPNDVVEFYTVYCQQTSTLGSSNLLIPGPYPIARVRELWIAGAVAVYPSRWAWFNNKLCFAPTISGVVTVNGDYLKDATRDTATGNLITASDTTTTNPWFDDGEYTLMNAVLLDYYLSIAKDSDAAQMCKALYDDGIKEIRDNLAQLTMTGAQATGYYDDRTDY